MTDNKFQIQVFSAGEIVPTFQPSAKFELTINQNKIVVAMAVSDIVSSAFDAAGPFEFRKDLTKAQASKLIDEMRKKAGVGDQV